MNDKTEIIETEFTSERLYKIMYLAEQDGAYVAHIRGDLCITVKDLFREVSSAMRFPYYFGWNWPALDECIADLDWLQFSRLLIIIDSWSKIFANEDSPESYKGLLIDILNRTINYWKSQNVPISVYLNNRIIDVVGSITEDIAKSVELNLKGYTVRELSSSDYKTYANDSKNNTTVFPNAARKVYKMIHHKEIISSSYTCGELYMKMNLAEPDGAFVIYIRGELCPTVDEFFREISSAMRFPYYFEWNWTALDECITDLKWLKFSKLLFIIENWDYVFLKEDSPRKCRKELKKSLTKAIEYWESQKIPITVFLNHDYWTGAKK